MTRLSLTIIFVLLVLISFGQINANNDSARSNAFDIKVTLLGTGAPQPIMERLDQVFLFRLAVRCCYSMLGVVVCKDFVN